MFVTEPQRSTMVVQLYMLKCWLQSQSRETGLWFRQNACTA